MTENYMRTVQRISGIGGWIGLLASVALCLNIAVESYIEGSNGTMILFLVLALPLGFFGMRIGVAIGKSVSIFFGAMTVDMPKGKLPTKLCSKCGAEITKTYMPGIEDECGSVQNAIRSTETAKVTAAARSTPTRASSQMRPSEST